MTWGAYTFHPIIPAGAIALVTALLIGLVIWNYRRPMGAAGARTRGLLAAMRIAVVLALALMLMRPMRDTATERPGEQQTFMVLVDTSDSMNVEDVNGASRLTAAIRALEDNEMTFQGRMQRHHAVELQAFGDGIRGVSYNQLLARAFDMAERTDLAGTLGWLASEATAEDVRGALIVSDGRDNAGGDVLGMAQYLKTKGIPVWTTTFGGADETKDVFITARFSQNFVFRGQEASLVTNINQTGFDNWYSKVEFYREGELVGTEQVMLNAGMQQIRFPVREEEKGTVQYTVKAIPLNGESDLGNNERTAFLQVADEKARVLFLEAEPYWDSKFLLRSLQADPNLEVTAIFHMSPQREKVFAVTQGQSGGPVRMPQTEEELFGYDCVIVGRGMDSLFSADEMRLFKAYVEDRGGGLVFARGKAYGERDQFLADLEPLIWDDGELARARFELTPSGDTSPIFDFGGERASDLVIRELPEMLSISRVREAKALAIVLAKTEDEANGAELATIAYQRYGKGKVMSVGTTGLWRWAFMRKELAHYDEVYARFWGQMLRWIIYGSDFLPGQDISFHADRHTYDLGEPVTLAVQTKQIDAASYQPRVTVKGPDGAVADYTPTPERADGGMYYVRLQPEAEGEYEATLYNNIGAPETDIIRFTVYSDAVESRMVSADPELMAQVATLSGARPVSVEEWPSLANEMLTRKLSSQIASKPVDAWDTPWLFSAIIGLLTIEWFIRRRAGMI